MKAHFSGEISLIGGGRAMVSSKGDPDARRGMERSRSFFSCGHPGGLTVAAIVTGVSAPTIGRRMLGLERQLGRTLFFAARRAIVLAHDGTVLLDHVRVMRRAADSNSRLAARCFRFADRLDRRRRLDRRFSRRSRPEHSRRIRRLPHLLQIRPYWPRPHLSRSGCGYPGVQTLIMAISP